MLRLPVRYPGNPVHWDYVDFAALPKALVCRAVSQHNAWVRRLHMDLVQWAQTPPVAPWEWLTPAQAQTFWHALTILEVPPRSKP